MFFSLSFSFLFLVAFFFCTTALRMPCTSHTFLNITNYCLIHLHQIHTQNQLYWNSILLNSVLSVYIHRNFLFPSKDF